MYTMWTTQELKPTLTHAQGVSYLTETSILRVHDLEHKENLSKS